MRSCSDAAPSKRIQSACEITPSRSTSTASSMCRAPSPRMASRSSGLSAPVPCVSIRSNRARASVSHVSGAKAARMHAIIPTGSAPEAHRRLRAGQVAADVRTSSISRSRTYVGDLSSFFEILDPVVGSGTSTTSMTSGNWKSGSPSSMRCSRTVCDARVDPFLTETHATTCSPAPELCGIPTTAACATSGSRYSTSSISRGATLYPRCVGMIWTMRSTTCR
mmetsp:Transcript_31182/g.81779  ORF Transcript_31182/g.81779 Transcript_31182/m.81779 type:complete len:222 (-) Transcript_31182:208-873(-)